jgi:hypothetical protein
MPRLTSRSEAINRSVSARGGRVLSDVAVTLFDRLSYPTPRALVNGTSQPCVTTASYSDHGDRRMM